MKHAMTGRNAFGQERPGEGQISVETAAEHAASRYWTYLGPVTCIVYPPFDDEPVALANPVVRSVAWR